MKGEARRDSRLFQLFFPFFWRFKFELHTVLPFVFRSYLTFCTITPECPTSFSPYSDNLIDKNSALGPPTEQKKTSSLFNLPSSSSFIVSLLSNEIKIPEMSTFLQRLSYWFKNGPAAPGTATRRRSASTSSTSISQSVQVVRRNPLVDLPLEEFLSKQLDASWCKLLDNVHPEGTTEGVVVASPSKSKPDYWYASLFLLSRS